MIVVFDRPDTTGARMDLCAHGKRRPDNQMLFKKPMMSKGTPEVCRAATDSCDVPHDHSIIEGRMRFHDADRRG